MDTFHILHTILPVIIIVLFIILSFGIFNAIFSLAVGYVLRKHFPDKFSELRKNLGKPLKAIKLILIQFGNEKKCYGSEQQHIPVKLLVYDKVLVFTASGRALVINNFNKNFISFINSAFYEEFLWKKFEHKREDLIIFSPVCGLQFLINKSDNSYLKNYIEEKKCLKLQ